MKLGKLFVVIAMLGIAGMVMAQASRPRMRGVGGKIVKIDGMKITASQMARPNKEAKEVVITTDEKTTFKLDDKDAKLSDLKVDMFVRAMPAEGVATEVTAFTKMPDRTGSRPARNAP
jgi:hypothetical protein